MLRSRPFDVWPTLALVLIGFACYATPWPSQASQPQTLLRIHGSNTIGAHLAPALVKGLFARRGYSAIRALPTEVENEQQVLAFDELGNPVRVLVTAHGSSTGFAALAEGSSDLAASSRPVKDSERSRLPGLQEQVIGLDGLAVIVHPDNPLRQLDTLALARLFTGEETDWSSHSGSPGPVRLYARDAQSGTFETFRELVLAAHGRDLSIQAQRFESSTALADAVAADPQGIGFIGLPYVRQARALAVSAGPAQAMQALPELIATEDYPLARRLYFYHLPGSGNPWIDELVEFAHSPEGQAIVEAHGFIAQEVRAMPVEIDRQMPADYQELSHQARRLSVNFRFAEGSAALDAKAQRDLERLLRYLRQHDKLRDKVRLVGFGDAKSDPVRSELLSRLRAMAVASELLRRGVRPLPELGLGAQMPVATDSNPDGRLRNRRVEVWVY